MYIINFNFISIKRQIRLFFFTFYTFFCLSQFDICSHNVKNREKVDPDWNSDFGIHIWVWAAKKHKNWVNLVCEKQSVLTDKLPICDLKQESFKYSLSMEY